MERVPVSILRGPSTDQGTPGVLLAPGFWAHTLELPDRANRTNRSRIPAGEYLLDWIKPRRAFSGFFELYWVHDVAGRVGILVHPATFAGDVELGLRSNLWGCIGLGLKRGTLDRQRAIFNSRAAVRLFHETMRRRPGRLTIKEVGDV